MHFCYCDPSPDASLLGQTHVGIKIQKLTFTVEKDSALNNASSRDVFASQISNEQYFVVRKCQARLYGWKKKKREKNKKEKVVD